MADDRDEVDRNLLLGLIALRSKLAAREAVVRATRDWLDDRSRTVADRLAAAGAIAPDQRSWLEAMVDCRLEGNAADVGTLPHPGAGTVSVDPHAQESTLALDPCSAPTEVLATPVRGPGPDPVEPEARAARSRFHVLRPHARGGLGEVFVARDEELGRDVALKEIQFRYANEVRSRARFLREAAITGSLEHPGVVPVYSLGRYPDGRPYYAMRFIRGESMGDAIERFHDVQEDDDAGRHELELRKLLRHFLDVCNAVGYAHSRGVLHRDLKPSNVMLGKYGETLVVDWGLAKAIGSPDDSGDSSERPLEPSSNGGSSETMPGSAIGTPQYMSPEQASGDLDRLGPASDIYSLGATLYAILTGHAPVEEASVQAVLHRVRNGIFPAPRDYDPRIPSALEAICLKAMALAPEGRYASSGALAEDVEHWLADEPVSARPDGPAARLARWGRRHRAWVRAGTAALGAVTLIALASAVVIKAAHDDERRARRAAEMTRDELRLDRSLDSLERDSAGRGVLGLAEGLAHLGDDGRGLEHAYRANLAAWRPMLSPLVQVFDHPDVVHAVAYGRGGALAIVGGAAQDRGRPTGELRIHDAGTGELLYPPFLRRRPIRAVAVHPDGEVVAAGGEDGLCMMRALDGSAPVREIAHGSAILALAFDPDGTTLATGGEDGRVRFWDVRTGRERASALAHPRAVVSLAYGGPQGERFATGCADGVVRIWEETFSGPPEVEIPHARAVAGVAFSGDGETLLAGSRDGLARLWDARNGKPAGPVLTHAVSLRALALSRDGRLAATGCDDNRARLWDAKQGREIGLPLDHRGSVTALALRPDGASLMTGSHDHEARLWRPARPAEPRVLPTSSSTVRIVEFGPDSRHAALVSNDGKIEWRDVTGRSEGPKARHPGGTVAAAVGVARDGVWIFTGGADGKVRSWHAGRTLRPAARTVDAGAPVMVLVAPAGPGDGESLPVLVGNEAGVARLWDMRTGAALGPPLSHGASIEDLDLSADGSLAMTVGGSVVRFWDPRDGRTARPEIHHPGPVYSAAFRPDGAAVVTGGESNTARLWTVATGQPLGMAMVQTASVVDVAFSPDGRSVLIGASDGKARLWDVATFLPIGPPIAAESELTCVALARNGRSALLGCDDGAVRVADVAPPLDGDPRRISLWAKTLVGLDLDLSQNESGVVHLLDARGYRAKRAELDAAGGPPR